MRLQKLLAHAGVASRRAAEELIRGGHVRVDGRLVTEMDLTVDPVASSVTVDGRPVRPAASRRHLLLNKPRGVLCTLADPEGRRTVHDLLPAGAGRVYPVGRLDWDAEGVLLVTDDGELAHRLMHPRYGVERTYHAKLKGEVGEAELARLARGVHLEDGRAGDCHYIKHYMPDKLAGRVICTNTTTSEDVEFFRQAGIKYLVTVTPVVAVAGKGRTLSLEELDQMIDRLSMEPQLQEWN